MWGLVQGASAAHMVMAGGRAFPHGIGEGECTYSTCVIGGGV